VIARPQRGYRPGRSETPARRGPALAVAGLSVSVLRSDRRYAAVDDVSFEVEAGSAFGLVGESGSGKSLTLRALISLLPPSARVEGGEVLLHGRSVPHAGREARRARRGEMAMIFQDSLSALDPVVSIGDQVAEAPRRLTRLSRRRAWERALELLRFVGLPDPGSTAHAYPHQISGGQRQRIAIAIALSTDPSVLLCDEPTTALDVTVQAQILDLLDDLRRRLELAIVFVSHDLAVIRQLCDQTAVMYTGRLVETGATTAVLEKPLHPYTRGLLDAIVDLDDPVGAPAPIPGSLPEIERLPSGCTFHPRCFLASEECATVVPDLRPSTNMPEGHRSACIHRDRMVTR
jgi:oligopeptide/dipeptide ABC transporter ATP-binding protein